LITLSGQSFWIMRVITVAPILFGLDIILNLFTTGEYFDVAWRTLTTSNVTASSRLQR